MSRELFSKEWDRMSFREQKDYQDRKLSYFIRTKLYPYSPFYRKMFDEHGIKPADIRGVDDLRRLPFTSKEDIAPTASNPRAYEDFILQPTFELMRKFMPRLRYYRLRMDRTFKGEEFVKNFLWREFGPNHIQFTPGGTGMPTPVVYSRNDIARMTEAGRRILELAGFGSRAGYLETRVVNAMPFAPHIGFWMVTKALDECGLLSLHTGGGRILGTHRTISAVQSMGATAIVGIPTYIYHLLRIAASQGSDFSSVKSLVLAGERLAQPLRDRMKELLAEMGASECEIFGVYGFTEARKSYSECLGGSQTGYHLFPDFDYIEVIDPETGERVSEGENGEIVYTCLEGEGTCLLRFRTGDYVKGGIHYEPCPSCGRIVPRLCPDISRIKPERGFSLMKLKGTLVDLEGFANVLEGNPAVEEWQVELNKAGADPFDVDEVNIYIALCEGANEEPVKSEIAEAVYSLMEISPNRIEVQSREELLERLSSEGGKELHVVDKRVIL
ncbi:MAG: AMP-binding protein [Actinomycetota bacterium]|nr:AMP-binding protein [Actinomycetota bacterium]